MKEIQLPIHGGGRLQVHGSLEARQVVVMLGRENFWLDDELMARLLAFLVRPGRMIARYETRIVMTQRLIDRPGSQRLPRWLRQALKAVRLLAHPRHWRHFSASYRIAANSVAFRTRSLAELVRFFGPGREIVVLTRSAGGRMASLVADQTGMGKLICLGYPFQHPAEAPDPGRYAHLEGLKTPFLILQGGRDLYGGREIAGRYRLGPATTLEWVDTDHSFSVNAAEWNRILARIDAFIGPP